VELALDRRHVREDVGVVVFKVVEDGHQRPVVHELAALVEEGGVVLIGLDHELAALAQRAETPKSSATPPIRKPGERPALSSSQVRMVVVVVLPWVPATARVSRPGSTCSDSHCAPEM
jgi:hypothetical protein